MNCRSIKNKKAELHTIIDSAKPDITLGNESWLTNDIKISEIFLMQFGKTEQVMPMVVPMVVSLLLLSVTYSVLKLWNWTPTAKKFGVRLTLLDVGHCTLVLFIAP